jgi:flagellar biogenesis protein FliO
MIVECNVSRASQQLQFLFSIIKLHTAFAFIAAVIFVAAKFGANIGNFQ